MIANFQLVVASCLLLAVNGFYSFNRPDARCKDPALKHGTHDSMETTWFHWTHPLFKKLNFFCDEGYELKGPKSATCQLDGTWSELPECLVITGTARTKSICDLPPIGDRVSVYPKKPAYDLEEKVIFVCPGPRKISNVAITECKADGQLKPELPNCTKPRCNPPESPRNGGLRSRQSSYVVGEVAQFKCAAGYTLVGSANVTCGEDGYFPYAETRCEMRGSCAGRCGEERPTSFCSCDPSCAYNPDPQVKCCYDFARCMNLFNWYNQN